MRHRCGLSVNPLCARKVRLARAELANEHNMRANNCDNKQNFMLFFKIPRSEKCC